MKSGRAFIFHLKLVHPFIILRWNEHKRLSSSPQNNSGRSISINKYTCESHSMQLSLTAPNHQQQQRFVMFNPTSYSHRGGIVILIVPTLDQFLLGLVVGCCCILSNFNLLRFWPTGATFLSLHLSLSLYLLSYQSYADPILNVLMLR
jgi:hypothetical protein